MQLSGMSDLSRLPIENTSTQAEESIVSFQAEIPLNLEMAMKRYIEMHPNWDQYRLVQAALAGFLVQNGVNSRPITRLFIENMFSNTSVNS